MNYEKYVASGNDFILTHTFTHQDRSRLARKICHRQNGVGADGFIVLLPSSQKHLDFEWEFYNSDGSYAAMCGNGSRAAALYAYHHQICNKQLNFLSGAGVIDATIFDDDLVEVKFTTPQIIKQAFTELNREAWLMDTGVPHLVLFEKDDLHAIPTSQLQSLRQQYNANVNIAFLTSDLIEVRTFERGVENETLACGTGMAACFLAAFKKQCIKHQCIIRPASQEELSFRYEHDKLYFKGLVKKIATFTFKDQE